jgi:hypothetical protein
VAGSDRRLEKYKVRGFMICTAQQMKWAMGLVGNLEELEHLEDLCVDGRIILKLVLKN